MSSQLSETNLATRLYSLTELGLTAAPADGETLGIVQQTKLAAGCNGEVLVCATPSGGTGHLLGKAGATSTLDFTSPGLDINLTASGYALLA